MCSCEAHSTLDQVETDLAGVRAALDRMSATEARIAALLTVPTTSKRGA